MGFRSDPASELHSLLRREGELVSVRVSVQPQLLEDLLDSLAAVSFSINPQVFHGPPTVVEFPAYELRLQELRLLLRQSAFKSASIEIHPMLDAISLG